MGQLHTGFFNRRQVMIELASLLVYVIFDLLRQSDVACLNFHFVGHRVLLFGCVGHEQNAHTFTRPYWGNARATVNAYTSFAPDEYSASALDDRVDPVVATSSSTNTVLPSTQPAEAANAPWTFSRRSFCVNPT